MSKNANEADKARHTDPDQVADWKILHDLSMTLLKPAPLGEKLDKVLTTVASFHGAKHGVISIYDEQTDSLILARSLGMGDTTRAGIACVKAGSGACGSAFATRERVIIENFENEARFPEFLPWSRQHKVGAVYSTPFYTSTGDVLGVLSLYFESRHRPTEREMRLADVCAGTVALFIDRDRTEETLRRERDRRGEILFGMAEGLCVLDSEFTVIEMNSAAIRLCKQAAWEVVGKNYWLLWPEAKNAEIGVAITRAMADRRPVHLENRWVAPAGEVIWFDVSVHPIAEGLAIYFRDITARKVAEEAILSSEARYRVLTETLSEIIWRYDVEVLGFQDVANWGGFTGQSHAESAGHGWLNAVHPDDRDATAASLARAQADGAKFETQYRLCRRDGVYRVICSVAAPVQTAGKTGKEWIGSCKDITDEKTRQDALSQSNRRKEEFLAVLSHELRGPLSAAKVAAKILETPGLNDVRTAQLGQVIGRQIGHMSRLVEDLVDVSRITQGLVVLHESRVSLNQVVDEAVEQVRPMMAAKRQGLALFSTQPCSVRGDKLRLIQAVSNLLSNAARYTPDEGEIAVYIERSNHTCCLKVVDNGVGIGSEFMPELFDLFAQAERSHDRKNGGLGLGLALVKSLVELHGGTVSASSDGKDLGSTFAITLPCFGEIGET